MSSRVLGCTIPLSAIRTQRDWGVGQIADLAAAAQLFARAGVRLLQILPPYELAQGETSPYGAMSSFALDPIYLTIERIEELAGEPTRALVGAEGVAEIDRLRSLARVDYEAVRSLKHRALRVAFDRFRAGPLATATPRGDAFRAFVRSEEWARDHALYAALRRAHAGWGWTTWPDAERDRHEGIAEVARAPVDDGALGTEVLFGLYLQWLLLDEWREARDALRSMGVELMGDLPFIVGQESSDVWAHRREFRLDVSLGAPPDDFAPEGQDWGLPGYDWPAMDETGLAWHRARMAHAARLYDRVRLDHVVGIFRMWLRRPGDRGWFEPWEEGDQRQRGRTVLTALVDSAKPMRIVAEDLGVVPPFVRETMSELGLAGYCVIPWEKHPDGAHRDPREFPEQSVATFSTHDTLPITAWWNELPERSQGELARMAGVDVHADVRSRELALLDLLVSARSELALVLPQELLGETRRINLPGTVGPDNWTYRLPAPVEALLSDSDVLVRFAAVAESARRHGRA